MWAKFYTPPPKTVCHAVCKFKPFLLAGQMKGLVSVTQQILHMYLTRMFLHTNVRSLSYVRSSRNCRHLTPTKLFTSAPRKCQKSIPNVFMWEPNLSLSLVLHFFFHKDKTAIQSCNVVWEGSGWCRLGGGSRLVLSGASKRSASPCQFCSSGSCSSRSWCVSQGAGGVRLWR